jgi:hypothetical protein
MEINWLQVLVAFALGVLTSAAVKGLVSSLKAKVG